MGASLSDAFINCLGTEDEFNDVKAKHIRKMYVKVQEQSKFPTFGTKSRDSVDGFEYNCAKQSMQVCV
eukprot:CAMPEP_0197055472 /NCGR_PEP_ID=MMETSP1384-20130603/66316_1 /TAXON_ID=29189 /ORGANISM="Ammonia sp." /LENGTH=67 /DNA_ID=CAMNT_0042489065 /DNA_START=27 /DNA_END=230 /DNA_ORIENTATION=+